MKSTSGFKVGVVVGTRPELIKMAPVMQELSRRKIKTVLVHTGQHYSPELDAVFFKELGIPTPDYNLQVGSMPHGKMVGHMVEGVAGILSKEKMSVVLVQGDTNSALAGALASVMSGIPVAHVEAGLRSYDRTMPEEVNRVAIDHIAELLFAPTTTSRENLRKEGIASPQIKVVGNTVVDAVHTHFPPPSAQKKVLERFKLAPKTYFILTLHRPSNVDSTERLQQILSHIGAHTEGKKVLFPVHPRTRAQIEKGIKFPKEIDLIQPIGYFDMLALIAHAEAVLTDSGGLQEETAILGIPCVTIRPNTERPETLVHNRNVLVPQPRAIGAALNRVRKARKRKHPFGKGDTARRIVTEIQKKYA